MAAVVEDAVSVGAATDNNTQHTVPDPNAKEDAAEATANSGAGESKYQQKMGVSRCKKEKEEKEEEEEEERRAYV